MEEEGSEKGESGPDEAISLTYRLALTTSTSPQPFHRIPFVPSVFSDPSSLSGVLPSRGLPGLFTTRASKRASSQGSERGGLEIRYKRGQCMLVAARYVFLTYRENGGELSWLAIAPNNCESANGAIAVVSVLTVS